MKKILFGLCISVLGACLPAFAASLEKAEMLNQHGLIKESSIELIDVLFDASVSEDTKAKSYYLLGEIAFSDNRIAVALSTWRKLVKEYPNSEEAILVKDRIDELAEVVGEIKEESIKNAVAASYLRHANFWSKRKSEIFKIDSSWIPNVEAAVKWYDRIIKEFPDSTASRLAYQGKMRTILGWEEPGKYGSSHGIKKDYLQYIPILEAVFNDFEKEHPNAPSLQAFRYQIAQAHWGAKDFNKTREWLNLIIEKSGDKDTFYKDLANRRLLKVEY